jgi:SAM-dependent methyltransferase
MAAKAAAAESEAGWDHVAGWYEDLIAGQRSDYHEDLIIPGVLRLLGVQKGQRILDVACGEGLLCRHLAELGVQCVGVDASGQLIAAAARLARPLPDYIRPHYLVGDVRSLEALPDLAGQEGRFDAAASVLALMNLDPIEPVLRGVARLLAPGSALTAVIIHPAFRAPGQTSWGFDYPPGHINKRQRRLEARRGGRQPSRGRPAPPAGRIAPAAPDPLADEMHQYRRVEAYLSPMHREIVMNPGAAAHGKPPVTTITFHRPIQAYVKAFVDAGFLIDALEEWPSHRHTDGGPFAAEHDRARREIPMFLAIRGRRVSG